MLLSRPISSMKISDSAPVCGHLGELRGGGREENRFANGCKRKKGAKGLWNKFGETAANWILGIPNTMSKPRFCIKSRRSSTVDTIVFGFSQHWIICLRFDSVDKFSKFILNSQIKFEVTAKSFAYKSKFSIYCWNENATKLFVVLKLHVNSSIIKVLNQKRFQFWVENFQTLRYVLFRNVNDMTQVGASFLKDNFGS